MLRSLSASLWIALSVCACGMPYPVGDEFADNHNGTVTDVRSGLEWQQVVDADRYDWKSANAYCAVLSLEGDGWRLPSKVELESIIDDTAFHPAIDQAVFPNTPAEMFWSSSPLVDDNGAAWSVNENGHSVATDVNDAVRVRCVRGSVDDMSPSLAWQQPIAEVAFTHCDAIAYCNGLSLDGGGWRLPTRAELLTLVDVTRSLPAVDPVTFSDTPVSTFFWSSTSYAALNDNAWIVYFDIGKSNYTSTDHTGRVRCVR